MLRIIHVSDLHFGKSSAGSNSLLKAVYQRFFKTGDSNTYLLVTGDITDDGEIEQYDQAKNALLDFRGNLLLVPGNHDYCLNGLEYHDEKAHYFDDVFLPSLGVTHKFYNKIPSVTILDDANGTRVVAIGLNSVIENNDAEWARGEIGVNQRDQLDNILSDTTYAGIKKIVYLHHKPKTFAYWFLALKDSKELMEIIEKYDEVYALAFGHIGKTDKPEFGISNMSLALSANQKPYFLDANSSVAEKRCFELAFVKDQDLEPVIIGFRREELEGMLSLNKP